MRIASKQHHRSPVATTATATGRISRRPSTHVHMDRVNRVRCIRLNNRVVVPNRRGLDSLIEASDSVSTEK